MGNIVLLLLAALCFFLGYVYLFNHKLALRWDNSRRRVLGQDALREDSSRWVSGAHRRGIFSMVAGALLLAIAAGVL